MTIVTRDILMQPSGDGNGRNLTAAFIRKHDREMGGRGKPRRYDLAVVDDFLHRYFRELPEKDAAAEANAKKLIRDIDNVIAISAAGRGAGRTEMVGRGGRQTTDCQMDRRTD